MFVCKMRCVRAIPNISNAVGDVIESQHKLSSKQLGRARINPITLYFNSKDVERGFIALYHGSLSPSHVNIILRLLHDTIETSMHLCDADKLAKRNGLLYLVLKFFKVTMCLEELSYQ